MMEEPLVKIKSVVLSNGKALKFSDYILNDSFEEDILEYIKESNIEYYAMSNLDLNTHNHILENADECDLVDELERRSFDFIDEVDKDDCIKLLEDMGYTVSHEDDVAFDGGLDLIDSIKLDEIIDMFTNASWSQRDEIYNLLFAQKR